MRSPADPIGAPRRRSLSRRLRRWVRLGALLLGVAVALPLGYYLYVGLWHSNFHEVVPGQVYRSGEPSSGDLRHWHERYGLKSVIDLRADGVTGAYPEEQAACQRNGMTLEYLELTARHPPDGPELRKLITMIEAAPRPLLLHCAGGADRAGFASFIAAMAIGGQDYAQAARQFSPLYFQIKDDPPIEALLRKYRQYCRANRMGTNGWRQFRTWAMQVYDQRSPETGPAAPAARTRPAAGSAK